MSDRYDLRTMYEMAVAMWDDPLVYHYQDLQEIPDDVPSVFLAGPSSRENVLEFKWRAEFVFKLRLMGYKGIIVVPEARDNDFSFKQHWELDPSAPPSIVSWECKRLLLQVKKAVFWIPRHQVQLPGRVTNTELGFLAGMAYAAPDKYKDRLIWGYPKDAWKVKSEYHWVAEQAGILPYHDIAEMCQEIIKDCQS